MLFNREEISIPLLVDVPAQFPYAGGFCITIPIKAGDKELVAFFSHCVDGWFATGNASKLLDNRINDLSDGFLLSVVSGGGGSNPFESTNSIFINQMVTYTFKLVEF